VISASGNDAKNDRARVLVPKGIATVGANIDQIKSQIKEPRAKAEWYIDETPQRKVEVEAFYIDVYEVTNTRFKQIHEKHLYPDNLANHPVVNVTWEKADDFCKKTGGFLPSEAQWERAARGDRGTVYPWGDGFDKAKVIYLGSGDGDSKLKVGSFELEKTGSNLLGGTSPVGSRSGGVSEFGAHDMAGNAWEWIDGWYDKERELHLLKGGSWLTPQPSVRSSARLGDNGFGIYNDYGFRCAYDHD
jgi:formylglycine-generating enzyme required for sulfatase activity